MIIRWLAAVALASCSVVAHADPIDDLVESQMRVSNIPAVAVAVIEKGRVVKMRAYGTANLEWNTPADTETRFQLASATKIFTGIVLMRLVEQGKLGLDDPVTRWIPDAPASWAPIRVRQLANHSSGLSDQLKVDGPRTVASIVAAAKAAPLAYKPGTEARYGLTDFTVLRAILEKAGDKTLPDLIRDEITAPLGMAATGFAMAEDGMVRVSDVLPKRASVYGMRNGRFSVSDFFFDNAGYGAGGLYASIDDIANLFAALDHGKLLKPESIAALELPATLPSGKSGGFGAGWVARRYRGVPVVGHSGGPALADILRVEDRQLTVAVLTNQQLFWPLLGEMVLDQYLTGTSDPAPLADGHAASTANVGRVFEAARAGRGVPAEVAEAKVSAPLLDGFGQALLRGLGPLQKAEPIAETVLAGGGLERRYRLRFERRPMLWKATSDASGRVTDLRPTDE